MTFEVAADGYDRFIGRYSRAIAPRFADFAGVDRGPVLDVGCGTGVLAAELASRVGAAGVAGVDPSESFVAACRARIPGGDFRVAPGEALPFADGSFVCALAQLVLSFARDADRMASEMARVVQRGGTVAFCMFEANGFTLVRRFWDAALELDPRAPDDARLPFRQMSELVALCERTGLKDIRTGELSVEASYDDFEDLWSPFSLGIGPAAGYLEAQTPARQAALRDRLLELLGRPSGAFTLPAKVLAVRGHA